MVGNGISFVGVIEGILFYRCRAPFRFRFLLPHVFYRIQRVGAVGRVYYVGGKALGRLWEGLAGTGSGNMGVDKTNASWHAGSCVS